jgi:fused signal recognition particle receptor
MFQFLKSQVQKFAQAFAKTRSFLSSQIKNLFSSGVDEASLEKLEQLLYEADVGSACAGEFVEEARKMMKKNPQLKSEDILTMMRAKALSLLSSAPPQPSAVPAAGMPFVVLVVGVNGSGKTTSIAKLARMWKEEGKKVLLAAADTFRAAAIDQLEIWAERLGVDIVKGHPQSDPSAVAFDALTAAKARGMDIVIIDTAGRLQNKADLMQQLDKMRRVCQKVDAAAPHQTLLVLDATCGQNAVDQARAFHKITPIKGIILTKIDGTAKGGIVLAIYKELGIPVVWIGSGEKAQDLLPFDPEQYVNALLGLE